MPMPRTVIARIGGGTCDPCTEQHGQHRLMADHPCTARPEAELSGSDGARGNGRKEQRVAYEIIAVLTMMAARPAENGAIGHHSTRSKARAREKTGEHGGC